MTKGYRVGIGMDAHRFAQGRRLILGGIEIPSDLGLQGHSDADVVYHALADAMLGAAGKGDIGEHFPDTDPTWKGVDSSVFIRRILAMLSRENYTVINVDIVIVAQVPRISPYRDLIRGNIAELLGLPIDRVNVKGKTTDQMGFTGRGEGIAAQVVILIESRES